MKWDEMRKRVDIQASLICVVLVISSCLAVFYTNYQIAYKNTIETLKDRTDAIYNKIDSKIDASVFEAINEAEDMDTELYQSYQKELLDLREVSTVRYLYTAKKNDDGKYIYLIDGLPLDSKDFRKPGEFIEEDIIDDITSAYNGNIILPNNILETSWGKIFLAYYPIHGGHNHNDEIIGVLGIEIDAETQYASYNGMIKNTPLIIIAACIMAFLIFAWCFKYISNPRRKDLYNVDGLTKLKNRASLEYDLKNIYMKEKQMSLFMIDLDGLKIINDSLGHDAGDEYIVVAVESIKKILGELGIAYRLGGDEFVVVTGIISEQRLEEMKKAIENDFRLRSRMLKGKYSLSIGYAIYDPENDRDFNETIKRADEMMYQHKKSKQRGYA